MNEKDLFSAIGGIDDELIAESEEIKIKRLPVKTIVSIAACLFLCLTVAFVGNLFSKKTGSASEKSAVSFDEKNVIENYEDADQASEESAGEDLPFIEFAMTSLTEEAASRINKEESYVAATYTGEDGREYSVVHLNAGESYYEVTILSDMSEIIGLSSYN